MNEQLPAPFLEVSEERFTRHWREHSLGGFQLAQAAIPRLLEHGGGSLFFTGASASLRGKAWFAPFASAKAAPGARASEQSAGGRGRGASRNLKSAHARLTSPAWPKRCTSCVRTASR